MWLSNWFTKGCRARRCPVRSYASALESLEPRLALAGNVTASVVRGDLLVFGDRRGADITISQSDAGEIVLTGNGTTVNRSHQPVTFSGVTRDVRLVFGTGADSLTLDQAAPIRINGNLVIEGGGGPNRIQQTLGSTSVLEVGGNLSIFNQSGGMVALANLNVKGNVLIRNLRGNSSLNLSGGFETEEQLHPATTTTIGGTLTMENGPGGYGGIFLRSTNVIGATQLSNRTAHSFAFIEVCSFGNLSINHNSANDSEVYVRETRVLQDLHVLSNWTGSTNLVLDGIQVDGNTDVRTGTSNDIFYLSDSVFLNSFRLSVDAGQDRVMIGHQFETAMTSHLFIEIFFDWNGVAKKVESIPRIMMERFSSIATRPVEFFGNASFIFGAGNDEVVLATDAAVRFQKPAILNGQSGRNTATVNKTNLNTSGLIESSFMNFTIRPPEEQSTFF